MPVHPSTDPHAPKGMEIASWRDFSFRKPVKASIIVRYDKDVAAVQSCSHQLATAGKNWAKRLRRIISLEAAEQGLKSIQAGADELLAAQTAPSKQEI